MPRIALLAELEIKPEALEAFLERVHRHGEDCTRREPGCLRFDVMRPGGQANRVLLYEVYADEAALEAHRTSDHMARYRADTAEMVADRRIIESALAGSYAGGAA